MYKLESNKTWRIFKKVCSLVLVLTFSTYVLPVNSYAWESTNYRLSTSVIASSGGQEAEATYELNRNTLGESVNGDLESANTKTKSGFLYTIIKEESEAPPALPPGTDYLAESVNFRQVAYLFSIADVYGSSANFNIVSGCVGEPVGGILEGHYDKSFSGHIYSILDNPPVLIRDIPAQSWPINTVRNDAFDLDDYFVDPDGDNLSFVVSGNTNTTLTIDSVTHQVSFSQNDGFVGSEEVIITAIDPQGNQTASHPITLNIYNAAGGVNSAPVLEFISDITAKEGSLIQISPQAVDSNGDAITYSFSLPFDSQGIWQTDYQSVGEYNITVTASDGTLSDSQEVKVTVLNVNRRPTLNNIADITGQENQVITITPSASDPDGDNLTFSFSSPFNAQGRWLPTYYDSGVRVVRVTVSDGSLTDFQDILVDITNVNTTPTVNISLDRINAAVDEEICFIITASDEDDDSLTVILQKDGQQFYSGSIYGFYVGSTSFSSLGVHTITAIIQDNHGAQVQTSANVEIIDPGQLQNKILPLLGDFNGDGLADIGTYNRNTGRWAVAISNSAGFGSIAEWLTDFGASTDWQYVNGDFNGDGKTDIAIFNQSNGEWRVGLSDGTTFNEQGIWSTFSSVSSDSIPITGDFNGDGVSDVGVYNKSNGEVRCAVSNKSSFGSVNVWINGLSYSSKAQPFTGDFNGDGLIDVGVFNDGNWSFTVSSGIDFITKSGWDVSFGADQRPVVSDFNNDGLTDIGFSDKTSGLWQIYHSTGDGFVSGGDWIDDFGGGENNTVYALDFNGDGLTDAAAFDNISFMWQRLPAQGEVADLLQKITNSLGGTTEISYKSSVNYDNTGGDEQCDLPFAMQTVSVVKQGDGQGNFYQTVYSYADGLYAAEERETRGFGYVKVTDAEGNISETWFKQDDIYKGLPYQTQISDSSGTPYLATSKIYAYTVPNSGCTFAYLVEEQVLTYDGQITPRITRASYEYDVYGNPTKITNLGDVDAAGDEKEGNVEYVYNPGLWILGLPAHTYLKDSQGQIVSQKWLYYDNHSNYTDTPTLGNLTKEENWLENGDNPSTVYTYDNYGNVLTTTDARGNTAATVYENTFHTYPETITNALGHTIQYTYDAKTGQILTSTDPNGQTSTNEYDVLGRISQVFGPNDDTAHSSSWYEYDLPAAPAKITTYVREEYNSGDVNKIRASFTFIDGLGRTIQSKTESDEAAKQIVSGITTFNSRGQVEHKYLPYLTDETTEYTTPDLNQPKAAYQYDCLGRLTEVINPDSTYQTVEYQPGIITSTDENGHSIRKHQDAYGQTVKIEEFNHGRIYLTAYEYDIQGNLLKTTDNQNNITSIIYDSLGRKVSMDDPDMGQWSYEYDANGNLTKQTDAKGQVLDFEYDQLNRLTRKLANSQTIVTYYYDETGKANCIGRLSKISDLSGQSEFFYDNLGREIKTIKTVNSTAYTVQRTYDALDRLISVTYPNGKVANYTYNSQGGIETVTTPDGSIGNIDYSPSDQIELIQYANGTETQYNYNPYTLRLEHLLTTSSSATLQDLTYYFDNVGNVATISDNSPQGSNTQSFQYDDLNRLISTNGSYGILNYQYDSIGNMIQKGGLRLTYGEGNAGPHAVTSITGSKNITMAYDTNGNMTSKGQSQYQYDIENRLTQTETPQTGSQVKTIEIPLAVGWNFFSIPLELSDCSAATVLSSIEGKYDQLTRYNSEAEQFESFINNSKFDQFSEFSFGEGYLIHISESCTLSVTGQLANSPTRQLKTGWNLIASPAIDKEVSTAEALNNLVQGTDYEKIAEYNGAGYVDNPQTLKPGKAYYIYALQDCTWEIPAIAREITEFVYDGDGGRVKKTVGAFSTVYIGSLYEEDSDGNSKCHIFLGSNRAFTIDTPTGQPANPQTYYYHSDHLGSSNVISDNQGNQAQLLEYTPFGLTNRAEGAYNTDYRFTGKLFDTSSQLYYYGARYYDPEIGRFITADSTVQRPYDPQDLNRYAYCRNNPIKYVDPTGHFWGAIFAFLGILAKMAATISMVATVASLASGDEQVAKVAKVSGYVALGAGIANFAGNFIRASAAQSIRFAAPSFTGQPIVLETIHITPPTNMALRTAWEVSKGSLASAAAAITSSTIANAVMSGNIIRNTISKVSSSGSAYTTTINDINQLSSLKLDTDIYGQNFSAKAEGNFSAWQFKTNSPYSKSAISLDMLNASAQFGAGKNGLLGGSVELSAEVVDFSNEIRLFNIKDTAFSLHYDIGWGAQLKGALKVDQSGGKLGGGLGLGPTFGAELRFRNIKRW